MTTEARENAETIFLALSHVPPDQRTQVLNERCGGDEALRREVERLLAGLDLPDSFLGSSTPRSLIGDSDALQPAGTMVGDFIVVRKIGSGGAGVVYLAHQQHPPRVVALKMLRREFMASPVQRRFEIEAELLGHLHHPGIAQIYAAHPGDAMTPPFIAMELVNGPPLTEYADSRQLSVHDRIELLARACDAVQHAHQRGIIHRDLKPGNILVNEDGQPKVLDFGVARTSGSDISVATMETEIGQLLGTVAYMSPEQVRADPDAIDTRSDIHALGVILFRLLTGRLPFGHDEPPLPELARRIVHDAAPRLGTIVPALRGDLETIVSRALAKEKERRYASAAGLATDLRRYLAGQPIAASADSAWYTLRRQLGRYRLALGLSAAAGVALAALASYATYQRARADQVNIQLEEHLATSTIERGRLLSITGNHPTAEDLVWRELFRRPTSNHARWTLWDIYSREPSLWESLPHEEGTQSVRFSPDGRRLLTSGRLDGLIRLIDLDTKQIVWTAAPTPRSGTLRALFTADGRSVVSGSADGSLRVWDAQSGTLRREITQAVAELRDLAITGEGDQVVTLSPDTVQAWSLVTGKVEFSLSGMVYRGLCITASPTGAFALAGSEDGALTALDLSRQLPLWQVPAHGSIVTSVAIAPQERWLASGGEDGLVHLWDRVSGKRLGTIAAENGTVRNLAFDADGNRLAATGYWRTRLWDLEQPALPPRDFGASEGMTDLHISPDNRTLATSQGGGGFIRLWNLMADSRTDHWNAHRAAVAGLGVATDGQWLFSAGLDGALKKWQSGQPAPSLSLQPAVRVGGLAVSQNGLWLASVGQPGPATVWDPADGRPVAGLSNAGSSRAVLFFDDDRQLIVGDSDGTLITWDWSSGVAKSPRKTSTEDTEVLAFATGGQQLYVAHRNQVISVRDVASAQEIRRLRPSAAPFSLAVSPDARLIAAGTWIGTVDVWEAETGEKLTELKGPTALVTSLAFSPDGALLAVSSRDGSTRLWDVAEGQWLAIVASRKAGAERIRFFPDGRRLAIGYADGEVEIRDLQYFFRYVAGHAEYQLNLLRAQGEALPRSEEVLAWTRQILSASLR